MCTKDVPWSYLRVPCEDSIAAKREISGEVVQEGFQVVTRRMVNLKCNARGISRAAILHIPLLTMLDWRRMGEYSALASLPTMCTSLVSTMRDLDEDELGASAAGALSRKVDINVGCSDRAKELIASG